VLRTAIFCLLTVLAITIGGCSDSQEPTAPTTAVIENTSPLAASVLPAPAPAAQQPSSQVSPPIPAPTAASVQVVVVQPTSLPEPIHFKPDGTVEILVTPVPATPLLTCMPQGDVVACQDELLDMTFRYPAFLGQILATRLRRGGYSGIFYEYEFENRANGAGGRSSDFGEGREGMYTDQVGFGGRTAADICTPWHAELCRELGPGAIMMVLLPRAEWLCAEMPLVPDTPRGILALDLPKHPLINGFAFSFPLLSPDAEAAFRDRWYSDGKACDPETKVELSAYVEQLRQDLESGQIAPELQQRYDAMIQLAASVQSPFFAALTEHAP
jgi:hypothetical protein